MLFKGWFDVEADVRHNAAEGAVGHFHRAIADESVRPRGASVYQRPWLRCYYG
jgi:hypothetical protein